MISDMPIDMVPLILKNVFGDMNHVASLLRASPRLCDHICSGEVELPEMTTMERVSLVHAFVIRAPKIRNAESSSPRASASFSRFLEYMMMNVTMNDVKLYVDKFESNNYILHHYSSPLHVYGLYLSLPLTPDRPVHSRQDIFYDIVQRIFKGYHISIPSEEPLTGDDDGLHMVYGSQMRGVVEPWQSVYARVATLALRIRSLPVLRFALQELRLTRVPRKDAQEFMVALGNTSVVILHHILEHVAPESTFTLSINNDGIRDWWRMLQGYFHRNRDCTEMELVYNVAKRACMAPVDAPTTLISLMKAVRPWTLSSRFMYFMREDVFQQLDEQLQHMEHEDERQISFWADAMSALCDVGHEAFLREFLDLYPGGSKQHATDAIDKHFHSIKRRCNAKDSIQIQEGVYREKCEPQFECLRVIVDAFDLDRSVLDRDRHGRHKKELIARRSP